jgi:hypothetical protein
MQKKKLSAGNLLFIAFILLSKSLFAQDSAAVKFFDFISEDSVVMYFDYRYNFTEKDCARYYRYTKIDTLGNFSGAFTDISLRGPVTGKGVYTSGIKNGVFENYHSTGTLKSTGAYKYNRPTGYWNFYHANGKPERKLLFNVADTLLLEYYNEKGTQTVKDGNGHFAGFVGSPVDKYYSTLIIAEGNIVNGKPDGEWITRLAGLPYCTEQYAGGKFVSGVMLQDPAHKETYNDFSSLNIIFQPMYFNRLEEFNMEECKSYLVNNAAGDTKKSSRPNYNLDNFRSYVMDAVSQVVQTDMRNGNSSDYQTGENLLRIAFTIGEKGVPTDFKKVTSWGDQFFNAVTTALSMHAKFPSYYTKLYLVITVTKDASNYLTYRVRFSEE